MKKKLTLLLSLVIMMFALTGCGQEVDDYNGHSTSDLKNDAVTSINNILGGEASIGDMEPELEALPQWLSITEEFGECKDIKGKDFEVTKSGNTLTTDTTLEFEKKDVVFEMVYDYTTMELIGITIEPEYTLGEKMAKAGQNTLISICIVFAVLILISLIISLFKIFPYLENKKKEKAKAIEEEKPQVDPVAQVMDELDKNLMNDAELVAVIAAAIAAYEGSSTSDFVVRSINRR